MSHMKHYARHCMFTSALLLLGASPALTDEASLMVLEGNVSAVHQEGMFSVFDPLSPEIVEWWKARWLSRTSDEHRRPADNVPLGLIAQAPVGPDGTFRLEIEVDKPRLVYFVVIDPNTRDSRRPGSIPNSNRFVLEPGKIELRMIYSNYSIVTGGYYNDAVYGSWRHSDRYRKSQAEYSRLLTAEEDGTEEAQLQRFNRRMQVQDRLEELEWEAILSFSTPGHDQLIQLLASDSFQAFTPDLLAARRSMLRIAPTAPESGEESPASGFILHYPPVVVERDNSEPDPSVIEDE